MKFTMPGGEVIDTTGAGDLFAAGYLFGRTNGLIFCRPVALPPCRWRGDIAYWRTTKNKSKNFGKVVMSGKPAGRMIE